MTKEEFTKLATETLFQPNNTTKEVLEYPLKDYKQVEPKILSHTYNYKLTHPNTGETIEETRIEDIYIYQHKVFQKDFKEYSKKQNSLSLENIMSCILNYEDHINMFPNRLCYPFQDIGIYKFEEVTSNVILYQIISNRLFLMRIDRKVELFEVLGSADSIIEDATKIYYDYSDLKNYLEPLYLGIDSIDIIKPYISHIVDFYYKEYNEDQNPSYVFELLCNIAEKVIKNSTNTTEMNTIIKRSWRYYCNDEKKLDRQKLSRIRELIDVLGVSQISTVKIDGIDMDIYTIFDTFLKFETDIELGRNDIQKLKASKKYIESMNLNGDIDLIIEKNIGDKEIIPLLKWYIDIGKNTNSYIITALSNRFYLNFQDLAKLYRAIKGLSNKSISKPTSDIKNKKYPISINSPHPNHI